MRWEDALARRSTAADDTSFLVAVWLDIPTGVFSCPAWPANASAPDSWKYPPCPYNHLSANAGGQGYDLTGVATFRFAQGARTGPAILRVRVHDPRAPECGSDRAICDLMIVVEEEVWAGDSFTAPQPYSVADVLAAIRSTNPSTTFAIPEQESPSTDIGLSEAIALRPVSDQIPADMQIAGAYLLPSPQAIHRALPDVQPGAAGAVMPAALWGGESGGGAGYQFSVDNRWLVVDNVAFSVQLSRAWITKADEAWLAELEAALRATHK